MKFEYYKRLKLSRRKDLFNQYLDTLDWQDWREIISVSDLIDDFKWWIEQGGHLVDTDYNSRMYSYKRKNRL